MSGTLTLVATPIGNLGDLSRRAREALERADLVACEDTRRTGRLMQQIGLRRPLRSLHEHNERRRLPELLGRLKEGQNLVLVSDAGTPLLSDPGYLLVREAIREGIPVEHVPGPAAPLALLVVSGLPPHPFTFLGFPPPRHAKRRRFYHRFASLDHTVVFFESPHRLLNSLRDALETLGDHPAAVGRELTKLHEEVLRGDLSRLLQELEERPALKGEFTIALDLRRGGDASEAQDQDSAIQQPPRTRVPR